MYTLYELTTNHTHLEQEVGPIANICNIPRNLISKIFYLSPISKCTRSTHTNFADNTEKAMYREKPRLPGELFLSKEPCAVIILVTNDYRVCIGRHGRFGPDEDSQVHTLKEYPISLARLRRLNREIYDYIRDEMIRLL